MPWAQRLGYLFDLAGGEEKTHPLARFVKSAVNETSPLMTGASRKDAPRDRRWKLAVNFRVEPDL
jgi:hypothetical protein